MDKLINSFYHNPFLSQIFPTLVYCLKKELRDCKSVLDIGCGPNSPLQYCQNIESSIGVEPFKPYLEESKKRGIHTQYLDKKAEELSFPDNSFDAVIMIEVLEHLKKKHGREVLKRAERWARRKVIVSTPNGYLPQRNIDKSPFQSHRSGWTVREMEKLEYRVYGLAGWKFLRGENPSKTVDQEGDFLVTIRFPPQIFWFIISGLTQAVTYYFPTSAFELFCVK